ncbi:MAG: trimeric intracellular cation channel family protein [Coriobacteriia bacterium]
MPRARARCYHPSMDATLLALASAAATAGVLPSAITTTAPAALGQVSVPLPLELAAVFVGAVVGGVFAADHKLDIMGMATLGIVAGLGGGIIRDVILLDHGVAAFSSRDYLITALLAAALGYYFTGLVHRLSPVLATIDAVSLGLFAIVGADKAMRAGLMPMPAILLGTITAVGGSVLRDMLVGDVPRLLRPGTLYGLTAVVAAAFFVAMVYVPHVTKGWAGIVAVALAVVVRGLSVWLKWETRPASDLSPFVFGAARRIRDGARDPWRR